MSDQQPLAHIVTPADIAAAGPVEAAATEALPTPFSPVEAAAAPVARLDLDQIEADLADVEIALARLDSGEYWRDEITGQPLHDALLAQRPTARRAAQ
jgi:hypothetical protein